MQTGEFWICVSRRCLFLAVETSSNFSQQLVLLLPARLQCLPKAFGVGNDRRHPQWYEEKPSALASKVLGCRFPSQLPAFALPRQMHPKGSRFIGSRWVTQPFLLTRAILAKVELQQTVENIRHSVVLKGLLGFPPSGD